jgi:hypothetical protein
LLLEIYCPSQLTFADQAQSDQALADARGTLLGRQDHQRRIRSHRFDGAGAGAF